MILLLSVSISVSSRPKYSVHDSYKYQYEYVCLSIMTRSKQVMSQTIGELFGPGVAVTRSFVTVIESINKIYQLLIPFPLMNHYQQ